MPASAPLKLDKADPTLGAEPAPQIPPTSAPLPNAETQEERDRDAYRRSVGDGLWQLASPLSRVLFAADGGSLFRKGLGAFLILQAILTVLGTFYLVGFRLKSNDDVESACGEVDSARATIVRQLDLPDGERDSLSLYLARNTVEECEEARKTAEDAPSKVFLGLALLLSGLGAAQIMTYRARNIFEQPASRYPSTPILAQTLRAYGETLAWTLGVTGLFVGLQIIFSDKDEAILALLGDFTIPLFGAMARAGGGMVIVGPAMGFLCLLITHVTAELLVAVVAIANHTAPKGESR